jgi:transposase InsO family protein
MIAARGLQWVRPKKRHKPGSGGSRPRIQGLAQDALAPFELVHGDSVELRYSDGQKRFIFTNLDHVTRKGFALAAPTKHARHAARLLGATKAEHPEIVHYHSDNGGDQAGDLDGSMPEDVTHWVSRPRVPEDNSRLERFHRTLIADCFPSQAGPAPSVAEMQAVLDSWLPVYNGVRPHAALGMLTPEEYIEGHAPPEDGTQVVI